MTSLATLPEDGEQQDANTCVSNQLLSSSTAPATTTGPLLSATKSPQDESSDLDTVRGVLFGRWIRSTYATLALGVVDDDDADKMSGDDEYHVVVRIQFQEHNTTKALQSYFRRSCKFGDLLVVQGTWAKVADDVDTEWKEPRLLVNVDSVPHAQQVVQLVQVKCWSISKVQEWQNRHYRQQQRQKIINRQEKKRLNSDPNSAQNKNGGAEESCAHHSGGLEKRQKGEYVANFLFNMMIHHTAKVTLADEQDTNSDADVSIWAATPTAPPSSQKAALGFLNQGSVLDVAGGSGHVSMALGAMGIQSTIVDPRESIGKLPGRDRKAWRRLLQKSERQRQLQNGSQQLNIDKNNGVDSMMFCQPVRSFRTLRAWFGEPPVGVDTSFRHPDEEEIMVCDVTNPLLQQGTAIVALHPDEATDAIVDTAVRLRMPFVIVPCCVFCRLFPHRRKPSSKQSISGNGNNKIDGEIVSTYADLLDYLQAKDPSIQRTTLPFVGANTVLWSVF